MRRPVPPWYKTITSQLQEAMKALVIWLASIISIKKDFILERVLKDIRPALIRNSKSKMSYALEKIFPLHFMTGTLFGRTSQCILCSPLSLLMTLQEGLPARADRILEIMLVLWDA